MNAKLCAGVLALSCCASAQAMAAECASYVQQSTLRGILSRHTFPEQPGYESIARGDRPATYFFVTPARALCMVAGDAADGLEPAERGIARIQLVLPDHAAYARLAPALGATVECRGTYFHAVSGHHHSPVLLGHADRAIPGAPSPAGAARPHAGP